MLIPVPLRFLVAATTALLVAALLVSSAAHGLMLGEATTQSALGSPLRVVIPITAGPGESLQPGCFRFVSTGGEGSASIVTARVSLERAAAASRLVVTTANSVNEPAIRFSIQAECDGLAQRAYVVLLDPPEMDVPAVATARQASAREPRQERLAPPPAAARRKPGVTAPAPTQVVQVPSLAARAEPAPVIAPEPPPRERVATAGVGAMGSSPFRHVAATPALPPATILPVRVPPVAESGGILGYLLAAGFAMVGALALALLFARRRQAPPVIPQWTRGSSFSDTRSSFADLSAAPVTLPHTLSHTGATTSQSAAASGRSKSGAASRFGEASGLPGRPSPAPVDPSTIDTLLDATDSDFVEERAVREAWAAARSDVERELDGNAILQAIEAAERDMHLAPPAPAQAAIERALEDDLLQPPRR